MDELRKLGRTFLGGGRGGWFLLLVREMAACFSRRSFLLREMNPTEAVEF